MVQNWKEQARRLENFNGELIPVGRQRRRLISKPILEQGYSIDEVLSHPGLQAIELKTSLSLLVVDFDSEKAIALAANRGWIWSECVTWHIGRLNNPSRFKLVFRRTPKQQKQLGEFYVDDKYNDLEIFSKATKPVTVLGIHKTGELYRWFGHGPEELIECPDNVWNFIVHLKTEVETRKIKRTKNTPHSNWRSMKPCTICSRQKDGDCYISKDGTFIQCHHGKTNHPPTLRVGETLSINGDSWAFCKIGDNAIGTYSLFKLEINSPTPWDIIHGGGK